MSIITVGVLVTAIPLLIGSFFLGIYLIPNVAPVRLMYVGDGIVLGFLFFWIVGMVAELQRTESLSLSKFMHLPVTVKEAFFINYISSLLRLSLIFFGPITLGFCLALIYTKGTLLVMALLLAAAFLLMITALTYQFQGWLAALMTNPRHRRTVVVCMTAVIILMAQAPNLINMYGISVSRRLADSGAQWAEESSKLTRSLQSQKIGPDEYVRRVKELSEKHELEVARAKPETTRQIEQAAKILNIVLPIGWFPLGVRYASEGHILPSLLSLFGMTLIGSASLWRAYHTTVGIYLGRFTSRENRSAPAVATPASVMKPGVNLLEIRIPLVSEATSVIALAGLRSLLRAPEAKMALLTSLSMAGVFGFMLLRGGFDFSEWLRPLMAIGAMGVVLMGAMQLMCNQFGFDRGGFRVFVLCAASRRDILLGKNLAFASVTLVLGGILLSILQVVSPMRIDRLLAMIPQYISMFLMCCVLTNMMSIYAPVYLPSGTLKTSNAKLGTVLLMTVLVAFVFPLTQAVTLLPLGIESFMKYQGWITNAPIFLVLSTVQCAVVVSLYLFLLKWQGILLQEREQKILDVVAGRS